MNKSFLSLLVIFISFNCFSMDKTLEKEKEKADQQIVPFPKAVFNRDIKGLLKNLISHEKTAIRGAYYQFDLPELAQAWAQQKIDHKISGGLVVHGNKTTSAVNALLLQRIPVSACNGRDGYRFSNMHHKFLCLPNTVQGKKLVVTGSFNFTPAADGKNYEDLVVIEDPAVYQSFEDEYKRLVNNSTLLRRSAKKEEFTDIPEHQQHHQINAIPSAYFSPNIRQVLLALIGHEQRSFYGASYRFNLYDVAQAWVKKQQELVAQQGGVKSPTSLLVDGSFANETPQALSLLIEAGVPVKELEKPTGCMHHKFFVFGKNKNDKPLLLTGSFNPTGQADQANWENIVVTDDLDAFNAYKKQLLQLGAASNLIPKEALGYQKKVSSMVANMNNIPEDKRH